MKNPTTIPPLDLARLPKNGVYHSPGMILFYAELWSTDPVLRGWKEGVTVTFHRNLQSKKKRMGHEWSVKLVCKGHPLNGKVIASVTSGILYNISFDIRETPRQRVIRNKRRGVHAWVHGTWFRQEHRPANSAANKGLSPFSYNPFRAGHFYLNNANRTPITGGSYCVFENNESYVGKPQFTQ